MCRKYVGNLSQVVEGKQEEEVYLTAHSACFLRKEGRKEMFYLWTHSTHFMYGYMASDNGFCYISCGALAGTRNRSNSSMKDRSDDPSHQCDFFDDFILMGIIL